MNRKNTDWARLVDDMLEKLVISQTDLGAILGVSQQYISHINNRHRTPSEKKCAQIIEIAKREKLDLSEYRLTLLLRFDLLDGNIRRLMIRILCQPNYKEIIKDLTCIMDQL